MGIARMRQQCIPGRFFLPRKKWPGNEARARYITGYGSTLYIGIAMVFVFPPYIWKFTSCFQFQVNLTFNDFTAQNMSKVICVPNISLNYHFWAKL